MLDSYYPIVTLEVAYATSFFIGNISKEEEYTLKKNRIKAFMLALLIIITSIGMGGYQDEVNAAGEIRVSHDVTTYDLTEYSSFYTGIEFLGNEALRQKLAEIYGAGADIYLGQAASTGDGVAWYIPQAWLNGKMAICANPFVDYGYKYTNRILMETSELTSANWLAFFDQYNSYRFPGHWQAEIDALNSNASSYSFISAILGGSTTDSVLDEIIAIYKKENPDAAHNTITRANLQDYENIMFWSWYFSLDAYLCRFTPGTVLNVTLPRDRWTQTEQFYNWVRGQMQAGRIHVTDAFIEVFYAPETPNDKALYSNLQVMHTFGATVEVVELPTPEPQLMRFQIQKKDLLDDTVVSGLTGAEFDVILIEAADPNTEVQPGTVVGHLVSDATGLASSGPLPLGTYDVVETKAPTGYDINPIAMRVRGVSDGTENEFTSAVDQVAYNYDGLRDFYNEKLTELNNANAAMANDETYRTYELLTGTLELVQPQDQPILSYYNLKKYGRISILKEGVEAYPLDSENGTRIPEGGVQFNVINQAGDVVDTITTHQNGQGTSKWLEAGTYTLSQVNEFDGYSKIEDFTVSIEGEWTNYTFALENNQKVYWLRLVKKDAETGVEILQAGVQFELFDSNGDKIVQQINTAGDTQSIFMTDEKGSVALPRPLTPGAYTIREIQGPTGYFLDPKGDPLTLTVGGDGIEDVVLEIYNQPQKGIIEVYKTGNLLEGYEVDANGLTQLLFGESFLAGTRWQITAAEDIMSYDGQTLLYHEGDFVEELVTTKEGPVQSSELALGAYYVEETQAPSAYLTDATAHLIEIEPGSPSTRLVSQTHHAFNERKNLVFEFDKSFEASEFFTIPMAATFGLFLATPYTENDVTIPQDSLLALTSVEINLNDVENQDGYYTVKGTFPEVPIDGDFYIKEMETSTPYMLNEDNLEISYSFEDTDTQSTVVTYQEPIINDVIRKEVEIFKFEMGNGKPIEGTEFQLVAVDEVKGEQVVGTYLTNEEGYILVDNLEPGDYYLKETKASAGYFGREGQLNFQLDNNGEESTSFNLDNEKIPSIRTEATIDGKKEKEVSSDMVIQDVVSYVDLLAGKEYELHGILMDKETGEPLLIDGHEVRSTISFIPKEPNGQITMEFRFDGSSLGGKDIVVFETLYRDGREVTTHQDINDKGQTVTIKKKPDIPVTKEPKVEKPKKSTAPRTGDSGIIQPIIVLLLAAGLLILIRRIYKVRSN